MVIRDGKKSKSLGGLNYNSIQLAKIKSTTDNSHSGKLMVWLINSGTDENDPNTWIPVRYASPFAGVSSPNNVDSQATKTSGQSSYGFFAVPPDPENVVLVGFINGEADKGYWFSATYADSMTYGMPGRAAGDTPQGSGKPSGEVNRYSQDITSPDANPQRPSVSGTASAVDEQGVADDPLLGPGNSSVARDPNPTVFGLTSPGGNQLIMDDGDGYSLIRLRTASGVQILLSETTGDIVLINKSGNGTARIGNGGEVDIYSSTSFNVFGGADINFKAGGSLNIEAPTINIKGTTVNIQGGTLNLKAGAINSSFINGDVAFARTAAGSPPGVPSPVGDTAGSAGSVTRTPSRGGKAS
jgi:hypothetical protein